ncbi:hypothetical protein JCM8097_007536 [Rhodosporidiobolus ruineniae]
MATAEIAANGIRFFTKHWQPTKATAQVLFVHGFVEHIERYDHAFPRFADQGISVFAYDQRGFGKTASFNPKSYAVTSWKEQLDDLAFFLEHARSLNPGVPLFLFGHSMGGGLSLAFCTRSPPLRPDLLSQLSGVIASSPLLRQSKGVKTPLPIVRLGSLVGKISGGLTLSAKVKPEDCTRDPEQQKLYANDPLCLQKGTFRGVGDMLLGGDTLVNRDWVHFPASLPLLIVHGTADKVTCPDASKEFVDKVKGDKVGATDATFKPFEGFYHEMHNEPEPDRNVELDYLVSWILAHSSSPSSASSSALPSSSSPLTTVGAAPSAATAAVGSSAASEAAPPTSTTELGGEVMGGVRTDADLAATAVGGGGAGTGGRESKL